MCGDVRETLVICTCGAHLAICAGIGLFLQEKAGFHQHPPHCILVCDQVLCISVCDTKPKYSSVFDSFICPAGELLSGFPSTDSEAARAQLDAADSPTSEDEARCAFDEDGDDSVLARSECPSDDSSPDIAPMPQKRARSISPFSGAEDADFSDMLPLAAVGQRARDTAARQAREESETRVFVERIRSAPASQEYNFD